MGTRWVIHVDLDAFYASVEELLDPSIAGQPVLVGGSPETRGVVASASYKARAYGVRSAMPMSQAIRLCPHAIVRPVRMKLYAEYSQRVLQILRHYTPLVEPISIDEAFLDVTGCERLWGPAEHIGHRIQERISKELGLSASLGIAGNKLVAKIACSLGKPKGFVVVPPGNEAAFLAPLPVDALWGVGKVTAQALHNIGVETIGQLAELSLEYLVSRFGAHGRSLYLHARGIDDTPVAPFHRTKSISHEHTFARDVSDLAELERCLLGLCDRVAARLRRRNLAARTVTLKMRYADFRTVTRRVTLKEPTDIPDTFYREAVRLLRLEWGRGATIRLLGVGVSGLVPAAQQLALFERNQSRLRRLNLVLDAIREKYGSEAILRASLLRGPEDSEANSA